MKLKEYLDANSMTAKALAENIIPAIPVACITRFVRKERGLSPKMAARISEATGGLVSIEELLYPCGVPGQARLSAS